MKLDLMSGLNTIYPKEWIAYDIELENGVRDSINNIKKYFLPNSITEVEVNNPQCEYLDEIYDLLIDNCNITIRGHYSNDYFKELWRAADSGQTVFQNYTIISYTTSLDRIVNANTFYRNDRTILDKTTLKKVILKK